MASVALPTMYACWVWVSCVYTSANHARQHQRHQRCSPYICMSRCKYMNSQPIVAYMSLPVWNGGPVSVCRGGHWFYSTLRAPSSPYDLLHGPLSLLCACIVQNCSSPFFFFWGSKRGATHPYWVFFAVEVWYLPACSLVNAWRRSVPVFIALSVHADRTLPATTTLPRLLYHCIYICPVRQCMPIYIHPAPP